MGEIGAAFRPRLMLVAMSAEQRHGYSRANRSRIFGAPHVGLSCFSRTISFSI
jgi:hypothetical protein